MDFTVLTEEKGIEWLKFFSDTVVKLSNVKDGSAVSVKVNDAATLEKLAAKSINAGDQVRLSYDPAGGSNLSKTFKKAEGC